MGNLKNILNEYHIFINNYWKVREENEGYLLVSSKDTKDWYCISNSFFEIIGLCDGKRSIKDIYDANFHTYSDIPLEKLITDIQSTLMRAQELMLIL